MVRIYPIIANQLYVSARTEAMTSKEKIETVHNCGITAVVNLWHTPDQEMKKLCLVYSHHPLTDGRRINEAYVSAAVDQVFNYLLRRHTVLVHCYGGRNRAGLICCLALRRWLRISGSDAVELFITARPNSLVNKHFKSYLQRLPKP